METEKATDIEWHLKNDRKEARFKERCRRVLQRHKIKVDVEKAIQLIYEWFIEHHSQITPSAFEKIVKECSL
jgi:hypothetical protein